MSRPLSFMPFYGADFYRDCSTLTFEEQGIYTAILWACWEHPEGGIPVDLKWLKTRLSGCSSDMNTRAFNRIVPPIIERFFTDGGDGFFRQKRLEKERTYARKRAEKPQEKSSKTEEKLPKLSEKPSDNNDLATVSLTDNIAIATIVALEDKKEPSVPKKPPAARGTRLTELWRPSPEGTAFATAELGGREAAQYEFSKFSEWFRSQPGAKGVKLDWELTWRVWVRTAKGRMRPEPKRVGGFRPTYL
jgi:uncharacterized protein YdaU (DUF1376 family)